MALREVDDRQAAVTKEETVAIPKRAVVWATVAEKGHQALPKLTVDRRVAGAEVPEDAAHGRWSGAYRALVPLAANVGLVGLPALVVDADEDFGEDACEQRLQPAQQQQRGQQEPPAPCPDRRHARDPRVHDQRSGDPDAGAKEQQGNLAERFERAREAVLNEYAQTFELLRNAVAERQSSAGPLGRIL